MTSVPPSQPPGWYYAQGDPPGTQRYWDGAQWQGGPQAVPGAEASGFGSSSNVAGAGQRFLARLIDVIIAVVISAILTAVIGGGGTFATEVTLRGVIASLLAGLIYIAIEVYMTANGGQTIGKKAMSTKVVREDGGEVDMSTSVMRFSPYIASTIGGIIPILNILIGLVVLIIGLASCVMVFTDQRRQAVWDKIAKTTVVQL